MNDKKKTNQAEDLAAILLIKKLFDKTFDKKNPEDFNTLDLIVSELKILLGSKLVNLNKYQYLKYTPKSQVTRYYTAPYKKSTISQANRLDKDLKSSFKSTYKRKHS